jgi:hypothetical protein
MRSPVLLLACAAMLAACARDYHSCEACLADDPSFCADNRSASAGVRDPADARCFAARRACDRVNLGDPKHGALCNRDENLLTCDAAFLAHFTFTCETRAVSGMVPWH